jgi:Protein phosphatase 2A regulatory B subunit (B56 family)
MKTARDIGTGNPLTVMIDRRTIHGLLYTALKSLIDMDPELYNKCEAEYEQSCLTKQHESEERQHRWEIIVQQASKSHDVTTPQESMQIDHTINIPEQIPEEDVGGAGDLEMSIDNISPSS